MSNARHNVQASDYRDHGDLGRRMGDLWENHGWMVWNDPGEKQVMLWLSPYRLVSRMDGAFSVRDAALSQTLLAYEREEEKNGLTDNSFIEKGWSSSDIWTPESLNVELSGDSAIWRIGGREYAASAPTWRVSGEHAGVNVDLSFEAVGDAFWFTNPDEPVERLGERWFVQIARASGWVEYEGVRTVVNGFGCHERHVHCGTEYDPVRLLSSRGVTWHSGGVPGFQMLVFSRPTLKRNWSRLVIDGEIVEFAEPEHICVVEEVSMWVDPRSRIRVPSQWSIKLEGPSGHVDIRVSADTRAYYVWPILSRGVTVLYWWLGRAEVSYTLRDGRTGHYRDVPYVVHDNRLLYGEEV